MCLGWWFERARKKPSAVFKALDGKLITYAVRRDPAGEIVIGKDGRICATEKQVELRFSDGSVPFHCSVENMEYGDLLSRNGVIITGDDTVTGRRTSVVAYYKYYR